MRLNREFVEAFAQTFIHMDRLAEDVALLEKELAASGGEEEGGTLKQRLFARRGTTAFACLGRVDARRDRSFRECRRG